MSFEAWGVREPGAIRWSRSFPDRAAFEQWLARKGFDVVVIATRHDEDETPEINAEDSAWLPDEDE